MFTGATKIVKPEGQEADEFEQTVAQELFNLEVSRWTIALTFIALIALLARTVSLDVCAAKCLPLPCSFLTLALGTKCSYVSPGTSEGVRLLISYRYEYSSSALLVSRVEGFCTAC